MEKTTRPGRIHAVMPCPRVGWNDSWACITSSLVACGIPFTHNSNAFWDHSMDKLFRGRIKAGDDLLLCIDYDSMFTKQHVNRLFNRMLERPDVDAICALQARRGETEVALIGIVGKENQAIPIDTDLIKVDSAHFGLTLIKTSSLKDVPRPWFDTILDSEGGFDGDDRVDADCSFWKHWREAGKTVFVDPTVRVGHLQLQVSEYAEGRIQHKHVSQWLREHPL